MGKQNGGGGFFAGFIVGAVVGGAAAAFLTQEQARDAVLGKAREATNAAADATGDLREKVADVTTHWQASAAELYERGKKIVDGARANVDAAVAEGVASAQQAREELERKAEE